MTRMGPSHITSMATRAQHSGKAAQHHPLRSMHTFTWLLAHAVQEPGRMGASGEALPPGRGSEAEAGAGQRPHNSQEQVEGTMAKVG